MNDYKRNIAIKLRIIDIISSEYKKDNENNTSFITLNDGRNISRVNIIGTIINISEEEQAHFTIDDGTGEIKIIPFNEVEKNKRSKYWRNSFNYRQNKRVWRNIYYSRDNQENK